ADDSSGQGPGALELDRQLRAAGLRQLDLGLTGACVGADEHLVLARIEPIEPKLALRMDDPLVAAGRAGQLDLILLDRLAVEGDDAVDAAELLERQRHASVGRDRLERGPSTAALG